MSPTFQAVTRSDNLTGLGNVPAFTLRHSVGAENGKGAGLSGCLGLWTSCVSRMNALSGRVSNDGIVGAGVCAGMAAASGVLADLGFTGILKAVMLGSSGATHSVNYSSCVARLKNCAQQVLVTTTFK